MAGKRKVDALEQVGTKDIKKARFTDDDTAITALVRGITANPDPTQLLGARRRLEYAL